MVYIPRVVWLSMEGGLMKFLVKSFGLKMCENDYFVGIIAIICWDLFFMFRVAFTNHACRCETPEERLWKGLRRRETS